MYTSVLWLLYSSKTFSMFHFWNFNSSPEESLQSYVERESALYEPEERWFIKTEVLALISDWSILMQMRTLNSCNLIGPKGIVLSGQNGAILTGWKNCWWGYSCTAPTGWQKVSVLLVTILFQELLYKGWPWTQCRQARHFSAGGRQLSAAFSLKCGLHERSL